MKPRKFTVKRFGLNFKIFSDADTKVTYGKFVGFEVNCSDALTSGILAGIDGKTVCDPRDEFKVSVGMEIVLKQMLSKIKSRLIQYHRRMISQIEHIIKFEKEPYDVKLVGDLAGDIAIALSGDPRL